jgi:glucose dehydrogenase
MNRVALCLMIAVASPTRAGRCDRTFQQRGDWPMAARDYASTRFSPLEDISPANVATLKLAYTFSTGVLRGARGSTDRGRRVRCFIVTPYPNIVYALDLFRPGAPLRWRFEPKPEAFAQGVACCDVVNRGLAYSDGKVFPQHAWTTRRSRSTPRTARSFGATGRAI